MSPTLSKPCSRSEAVAIARAWLGTPYRLGARVKGAGCDCATLLAEYLIECGVCEREELGLYSHDWFCHATSERYLLQLVRYARKTAETVCHAGVSAQPGDLVIFRTARSRVFNHGAIVTQWPRGIHAVDPTVRETDLSQHYLTGHREMDVFSPWV